MGYWDGLIQNKSATNQGLSVVKADPVSSIKVIPAGNNQRVVVTKHIAVPGDKDFIGPVAPRPKQAPTTPTTTAPAPVQSLKVAPVYPQGAITIGGKSRFQTPTAPVQQTNITSQDIIPAAGDAETKMRQASLPVEGALPSPTSKGDGFWAGLIKSPIKALVVRPAIRTVQAVIAPSQISASSANSQRRNELSVMQNKLALALRAESNPAKRNRLATQIAENQKILDQSGAEGEIVQKTIDKLYNDTTVNTPVFGDFTVSGQKNGWEGVKQIAGETLESASYIYAGQGLTNIGANLVKGAVAKAALSSGAIGTVGGGAFGLAQSLQENAGAKETLINTAVSAAVGGLGGAALGAGTALAAKGISKAITLYGAQKESLIKAYIAQGYSPAKAKVMAEQGGFVRIQPDITGVDKAVDEQGRVMAIAFKNNATGKPEILFNKQAGKSKLEEIERGFISTVKSSPNTAPQVSSKVAGTYTRLSNQQTAGEALRIVNNNPDVAYRIATQTRPTAKSFAVAQQLITKYQKEGNFEQAINLTEIVAKKATQSGQAIQALSMYNRLTPEGVLRFAQRVVDKANDETGGKLKLDEQVAKRLYNQSKRLQAIADGRLKEIETAKLVQSMADIVPPSLGRKISAIQTMSQLLNPKTFVRNVVGNTSFAALENVSDVVGTPIDKAVSLLTGKRTKGLPSLSIQARGFRKGLKEGVEDALLGINTSGDAGAKFDLPHSKIFKGKILGSAEKLLNLSLRAPDRAGYEAAFQNSIANQMKFAKVTNPTDEMIHIANLDGLYRTFNDDSVASQAFSKIKNALNTLSSPITGKDWGLGDAVLKYPKTPGNLLARGIDYSPAGFLKSITQLARPLVGKEFNQKAFVESTSRALVGSTGLVGTGAILHRLGIITGKPEKDADMNALQRTTGLGQYKMNVSALKRFVFSGFDPSEAKLKEGDKLLSYDWMQPAAIGLAIGANIDDTMSQKGSQEDKAMSFVGSLIVAMGEGVDTLGEQPLVQGVTRPFKYATGIGDAAIQTLKSVPASFIPSLLSQIRYLVDPSQRNVNDPDVLKETMKLAQNRIPGLSKLLPQKYSGLGEPLRYEQGPISTLVNPAIMSKYVVSPEQKMVFDIFNRSGEKTQVPRFIPKTEKVNGQSIQLTGEQQSQMQQIMGQQVKEAFARAATNKAFLAMTDEDKAKTLASIMTDIHTAVKYEILGHRPSRLSDRAKFYVRQIRKVPSGQAIPESESSSKTISPEAGGATKTNYWSGLVQP